MTICNYSLMVNFTCLTELPLMIFDIFLVIVDRNFHIMLCIHQHLKSIVRDEILFHSLLVIFFSNHASILMTFIFFGYYSRHIKTYMMMFIVGFHKIIKVNSCMQSLMNSSVLVPYF